MDYGYFLIPATYASDGKLPLDYKLTFCKLDKRTRFWRMNAHHLIFLYPTMDAAQKTGMQIFRDDHGAVYRFLAPNGKAAHDFHRSIVYRNQ